jgi:hypothetical protein
MSDSDSNIIIAGAAFIILSQTLKKKRKRLVGDKFNAMKDSG